MSLLRAKTFLVLLGLSALHGQLPVELEEDPEAPGWHERSLEHDDLTRWYLIYRPTDLPANAPVVILLHGGGGGMRTTFRENRGATLRWPYLAEEEKFVLVAPNGVDADTGDTYGDSQNWSDLSPRERNGYSMVDDVGFLRKLIDAVVLSEEADPLRFYFTGVSNGGGMSMRAGIELGGRTAAIATFSSNLTVVDEDIPAPQRHLAVLICSGTEDPLMKYEGEPDSLRSAEETVAWWIDASGAEASPSAQYLIPDIEADDDCLAYRFDYQAGPGGAPVSFIKVEGGGHGMPSVDYQTAPFWENLIGPQCGDFESADVAWEFLRAHSIPLDPRLELQEIAHREGGFTVQLAVSGAYPGGNVVIETSDQLDDPDAWAPVLTDVLGDLGELTGQTVERPAGRLFFRVCTAPLGR